MVIADHDFTLETSQEDAESEEEEEDVLAQYKRVHTLAAKEKDNSRKEVPKEREPPAKRQRLQNLDPIPATSTPSTLTWPQPVDQQASNVQPAQPPLQPQQQGSQGYMMVTLDMLESLVTNVASKVSGGAGNVSLQEAILNQTSMLTQAVKGQGIEDGMELEPKLMDSSWWLVLKNHDIEDNSQTKL